MASALQLAKYLVYLAYEDDEMPIPFTNLKVNALLYYAQVYCMAHGETPLFQEPMHATENMVIVPQVYSYFEKYGFNDIPQSEGEYIDLWEEGCEEDYAELAYGDFAHHGTITIMESIMNAPPYQQARKGAICVITKELLQDYVNTLEELPRIDISLNY